jgi:drug/metabolite transporter (DMT)-like permease
MSTFSQYEVRQRASVQVDGAGAGAGVGADLRPAPAETAGAARGVASGFAVMLLSIAGFSIMGVLVRGERALFGPNTAMIWRALIGLAIVLPMAAWTRTSLRARRPWLVLLRGLSGAVSLLCFLTAIKLTDLGTATALCYIYPVVASLLSAVFLKETMPRGGWLAILIAWLGVAVMVGYRPSFGFGELCGLASGILAGVAIHAVRALKREGETTLAILGQFFLISLAVALPGALAEDASLGFRAGAWRPLLVVGASATLGQAALTKAYGVLPTRLGSPLSLLVVPISMIGVYAAYGEAPAHGALLGTVLLAIAVTYLSRAAPE